MTISAATKTARPLSIEEPASIDAAPTSANDETTRGAHFAGLLPARCHRAVVSAARAPAPMHESEVVADLGADDEEEDGGTEDARINPRARRDKAGAKSVVAERLLASRIMNGLSQGEAAIALGYTTPAQLSQHEQCRRPMPLHMLMRASAVYAVSMDYLTGLSSDPERDVRVVRRNACVRAVHSILVAGVERIVDAFDADESITGLNIRTVRELVTAAEALTALYDDFSQKHQAGPVGVGARLAAGVGRLESAALKTGIALRRHDDEDAALKRRLAEIASNDPD